MIHTPRMAHEIKIQRSQLIGMSLKEVQGMSCLSHHLAYVVLDFFTLMIYGLAAEKISIWLRGKPKLLNTISACVLLILAVYIAATQNF